jgi:ferritin-like metal-binding protein YciE
MIQHYSQTSNWLSAGIALSVSGGNVQIDRQARSTICQHLSLMEAMMSKTTGHITDWLRDAHAMEEQAETLLKGEIGRIKNYPELTQRLEQELKKTLAQQEQVKQCLTRLDAKHSTVKDIGAKLLGVGQDLSGIFVSDEVVKGVLSLYVFTHMGICSYRMLAEAAAIAEDEQTRQICERLMKSKEEFAAWLMDFVPRVTREFLQRSDSGSKQAKR